MGNNQNQETVAQHCTSLQGVNRPSNVCIANLNFNTRHAKFHTAKFHSQPQLNDHSLHSLTDTLNMTESHHHSGNNT